MLLTLIIKEIHETIISGKFVISSLLLIILIPLGIFITLQDYQQRVNVYNNAQLEYLQRNKGEVNADFNAEVYRPPSPLSALVVGIEPFIPNKAVTQDLRDLIANQVIGSGAVEFSNENSLDNLLSALFGKMDYLFNVSIVLSMLVFLFTFNGITGEKEQGTLKQIMSNPVVRWSILVSKLIGNFILFFSAFSIAFLIGILILGHSNIFPLFAPGILTGIIAIFITTIIFLFCMFALGMLVSAVNHSSTNSIISLLFIWVFLALVIPKLSPMVAQTLKPVTPTEVATRQLDAISNDLEQELNMREDELFKEVLEKQNVTETEYNEVEVRSGTLVFALPSEQRDAIETEYENVVEPLRQEYAERIATETAQLQREYENERKEQQNLAIILSRLSPISCVTYMFTAVASTNLQEVDSFSHQAQNFQNVVIDDLS